MPFFVKVVQTAVAHAWDFAVHLVTAQKSKGGDGSRAVPAQKKDLVSCCIHRSQIKPFLSLKKIHCVIYQFA